MNKHVPQITSQFLKSQKLWSHILNISMPALSTRVQCRPHCVPLPHTLSLLWVYYACLKLHTVLRHTMPSVYEAPVLKNDEVTHGLFSPHYTRHTMPLPCKARIWEHGFASQAPKCVPSTKPPFFKKTTFLRKVPFFENFVFWPKNLTF